VNIAYVVNGTPIRGIVYAPAKQRLFYTDSEGQSLEETGPFEIEKSERASIFRLLFQTLKVYALSRQNRIETKPQMPILQNIQYQI
jgi:fructose-1,6-bisphosphatase/inositol monophosphatase family enzyme